MRLIARLLPLAAALGLALPGLARADATVRLSFTWADPAQSAPLSLPQVQASDLLGQQPIPVAADPQAPAGGHDIVLSVPDAAFAGPYARLRLAVSGLSLPPGDSKSDQPIQFAFELVLRRDSLSAPVVLAIPVVTSSRRGALKPFMALPQIAEDLPARFFMAQQWMSLYQASPEAVAEAPQSFALHRAISRAIADFAIAMADTPPGPALVVPSEELGRVLELYWDRQPKGREIHLTAYADARTILWRDLRRSEDLLREARRAGVDAVEPCEKARALLGFFAAFPPAEAEARKVDALFANPGSLAAYLEGRALDVKFACTRLRF